MNIHVELGSVRVFIFFIALPHARVKNFWVDRKKKRGYSSMCSGRIIWVDLPAVWNEEDVKKRVEHLMLVLVQGVVVSGDRRGTEKL